MKQTIKNWFTRSSGKPHKGVDAARRALFTRGGIAVGATLASAGAGAATLFDSTLPLREQLAQLHQRLGMLEDRDAIVQLHDTFTTLLQQQNHAALVELFSDDATLQLAGVHAAGKQGIRTLFLQQYATQTASAMCTTVRSAPALPRPVVELSADRQQARASFHQQLQVVAPLCAGSSAAQMAQLQGLVASSQWQQGRFEVAYLQREGRWLIEALAWQQA